MSDFVVRIDVGKLNPKQAAAIESAIQGVVLSELGKLDLTKGPGVGSILRHPEWRGLWIRNLKSLQDMKQDVLKVEALTKR